MRYKKVEEMPTQVFTPLVKSRPKISIKLKFTIAVIISLLIIMPVGVWNLNRIQGKVFEQEAYTRSKLVLNFGEASRNYVIKELAPAVEKHTKTMVFEAQSNAFATRKIFELFNEQLPDYIYKQPALNPLNYANKADKFESEIITYFQNNQNESEKTGYKRNQNTEWFYVAKPIIMETSCLKCHGRAEDAPQEIRDKYGTYTKDLLKLIEIFRLTYPQPDAHLQKYIQQIDLEFVAEDLPKLLSSMKIGSDRIDQIVLNLRNFSRLDQAEMKSVNLDEGIDSTLVILQHRLKANSDHPEIIVIKEYAELPLVECYPGQLNQVFMNLLSNAIDALVSHWKNNIIKAETAINFIPQILIKTEIANSESIIVKISDNGSGMPEKVRSQIFNPFFTTKPIGKGTGLGLSISYKIVVEKHQGSICCESELGKGTTFCIQIPVKQAL